MFWASRTLPSSVPLLSQTGMNNPTQIASDGNVMAVSDTDNNRVLIWKQIPTSNQQPADVVLGQPDFTTEPADHQPAGNARAARTMDR